MSNFQKRRTKENLIHYWKQMLILYEKELQITRNFSRKRILDLEIKKANLHLKELEND